MHAKNKPGAQRGVALLTVMLFLILISAMGIGLMYMASTETQINANFRDEQKAYFAAKAGLEEIRDRMRTATTLTPAVTLPTSAPTGTSGFVYLLNPTPADNTVNPWATGKDFDTELCHSYPSLFGTSTSDGVPCTSAPGSTPPTTINSVLPPFNGTNAALPFRWARLSIKSNGSVPHYKVDSSRTDSTTVCWDGTHEVALETAYANCSLRPNSSNPVYLLTALAVTSSGTRKMVQADVALNPAQPFPYGLFATSTGCPAITVQGGSTTDSYTTAGNGTYQTTVSNHYGDIGSNGTTVLSGNGTTIGGSVGGPAQPAYVGSCPATYSTNGGASLWNGDNSGINQAITNVPTIITIATPAVPTGVPTGNVNIRSSQTLPAGTYGDLSINSGKTLTLSGGTYNINSITLNGTAKLDIQGPTVINVVGATQNGGTMTTPIDLTGNSTSNSGSLINETGIASNLQINYAGTGNVKVAGGSSTFLTVDAPNASVQLTGGSDIYGSIVGNTITVSGGTHFHYDLNSKTPIPSNGNFALINFRELFY